MSTEEYPRTPVTGLTLTRIRLLTDIERIASEAAELPDADLLNIFHSMCRFVGSHGASYTERIALAGYAIAISERNMLRVVG